MRAVASAVGHERGGMAAGGRPRRAVLAAALLAALFLAGTVVAPLLESAGSSRAGVVRALYGPVCHQLPERSLTVAASPLAVCARCSGLYLGGVVGLFVAAAGRFGRRAAPRPVWLAVAVAPTVADAVLAVSGLGGLSELPRFALAVPAGFVAALFLAVGIRDLSLSSLRNSSRTPHDATAD